MQEAAAPKNGVEFCQQSIGPKNNKIYGTVIFPLLYHPVLYSLVDGICVSLHIDNVRLVRLIILRAMKSACCLLHPVNLNL